MTKYNLSHFAAHPVSGLNDCMQDLAQLLYIKGLGHNPFKTVHLIFGHHRVIRVPA